MKKLSISSQLLLIIFTTLLIATFAFSAATISYSSTLIEREVYNRLSTYVMLVREDVDKDNFMEMSFGYYIKDTENTISNYNSYDYLNEEEINLIIEYQKNKNREGRILVKSSKIINKHKIYYVCATDNNFETFNMIFTDNQYYRRTLTDIVLKINAIFFILLFFAIVIIFLWSNNLSKRLKNIQNSIIELPKNNYQKIYTDDYQDEIGELSRSVDKMRIELYENEKTKQEMLHNLSHDFKTPIAVIKSYAEAIDDRVEDTNVATKKIVEQSDVLKKKVNQLIEYNKIEYFSKDKELEEVNMADLIDEIVLNYKYQLNDINIELDLDRDVYFKGYRDNWYVVIDNIIDNAKRYAKTTIKIILKTDRIRIYNDGEHIDEKFINNQFKPYEKGSNGEFGLGMSIVQKTVDIFGMNLIVVNEEIGVSFIIEKPRRR